MDNERKYDGMLIVETSRNESESADFQTLGSVRQAKGNLGGESATMIADDSNI